MDVLMPFVTKEGEEGVITAWFVDEGQLCRADQLIAEVQVEKVAAEVAAPQDGYVVNRVAIGDPVQLGTAICQVMTEAPTATRDEPTTDGPKTAAATATPPAIKASPAAKRLGRELGVDLSQLVGSGPGGRITEADVQTAEARTQTPAASNALRDVIARNMRRSHTETAPVTLHMTAHFGPDKPSKINARVIKAVATALVEHPSLNGTRNGDTFEPSAAVNVGVAIQTLEGLVAPVVADVTNLTIEQIADHIRDLADRARNQSLTSDDYQGGTFTVTNLGSAGIEGFTPIINLPQIAILGVGSLQRTPAFDEQDRIVVDHQLVLSLTFDHAFVDGEPAAQLLRSIIDRL